ncbi:MAG: hypothetical protein HY567_03895 [Candidatus Kerfeldbacteria bacterium]|nr:hypothetical protein [Candidatus Kerfeldbacteria bacterium]
MTKDPKNELAPYTEILAVARQRRFREWEPKLRLLAEQFNRGRLQLPPDPVLRASLLAMQERNGVIDMSTVDTNCRMLAQAVWDAQDKGNR